MFNKNNFIKEAYYENEQLKTKTLFFYFLALVVASFLLFHPTESLAAININDIFNKNLMGKSGSSGWTLKNFFENTVDLWQALIALATVIGWITGVFFVGLGVLQFVKLGERKVSGHTPFLTLLAGFFLVSFATKSGGVISTLFEEVYVVETCRDCGGLSLSGGEFSKADDFGEMRNVYISIMYLLRLVGISAIVKGFIILKRLGEGQQNAGVASFILHTLCGAFLLNAEKLGEMVLESVK